jgi:predicted nucleotidyltransferase component of viral defense system
MLTQTQTRKYALEQHTTVDNILKEHYQIYLLDLVFNSSWGNLLVFKGGTALKLVYGSMRFSEDLDFSLSDEVDYSDFKNTVERIEKIIPEARVKDIHDKRFTLYARIMFDVDFQPVPIGIKIEINKNPRNIDPSIGLIHSPFNNLEIIGRIDTLESILKDKIRIIEHQERREPRDLFDAWYISQKLNRPFIIIEEYKYSQKELMDRLNPFLPQSYRKVIDLFKK